MSDDQPDDARQWPRNLVDFWARGADEGFLDTEQMILALSEMPPGTGYLTFVGVEYGKAALCLCMTANLLTSAVFVCIARDLTPQSPHDWRSVVGYEDWQLFNGAVRRLTEWPDVRAWLRCDSVAAQTIEYLEQYLDAGAPVATAYLTEVDDAD